MLQSINFKEYEKNINNYEVVGELNNTNNSNVYLARDKSSNEQYAIKVLKPKHGDPMHEERIKREIEIMISCQHPTIAQIVGYSTTDFSGAKNTSIITKYWPKGNLSEIIEKSKKGLSDLVFDNTKRQIILIGVAKAMMFLHQHRIIHRDLKLENVLINDNYEPLLTDFNLSKICDPTQSMKQSAQYGSPYTMAPEIFALKTMYGFKADVYSYGILMYMVIFDEYPFPELINEEMDYENLNKKMKESDFKVKFPYSIKLSFEKLIEKCLSKDPIERPTFSEIYNALTDVNNKDSCTLEDVDDDEVNLYLDSITEINPVNDVYLLRLEFDKLRNENQTLKKFQEQVIRSNEYYKKGYDNMKNDRDQLDKRVTRLEKIIQNLLPGITDENDVICIQNMIEKFVIKSGEIRIIIEGIIVETVSLQEFFNQLISKSPLLKELMNRLNSLGKLVDQLQNKQKAIGYNNNANEYEHLLSLIKELQNKVDSITLQIDDLQNKKKSMKHNGEEEEDEIMPLINQLKEKVTSLEKQNEIFNQALLDRAQKFRDETEKMRQEFKEEYSNMKLELLEENNSLREEFLEESDTLKQQILDEMKEENEKLKKNLNDENESAKQELRIEVDKIKQELIDAKNELTNKMQQYLATNEATINQINSNGNNNNDVLSMIKDLQEKINTINKENKLWKQTITSHKIEFKKQNQLLQDLLKEQKEELQNRINQIETSLKEGEINNKIQITSSSNDNNSNENNNLFALIKNMQDKLNSLSDENQKLKESLHNQTQILKEKLIRVEREAEEKVKDIEKSLHEEYENKMNDNNNSLFSILNQLQDQIRQVDEKSTQQANSLSESFNSEISRLSYKLSNEIQDLKDKQNPPKKDSPVFDSSKNKMDKKPKIAKSSSKGLTFPKLSPRNILNPMKSDIFKPKKSDNEDEDTYNEKLYQENLTNLRNYLRRVDKYADFDSCFDIQNNFMVRRLKIHSTAVDLFNKDSSLNSNAFNSMVSQFNYITVEIKYPTDWFDKMYDFLLNSSKQNKNQTMIFNLIVKDLKGVKTVLNEKKNIEIVNISDPIQTVGQETFCECSNLISINTSPSVETIEFDAFYNCQKLYSAMLSSVVTICDRSFCGCLSLNQLTIPSTTTTIGNMAFKRCISLEVVNFNPCSKLKSIGNFAFNNCDKLKIIRIPSSVVSIGDDCFKSCPCLCNVSFEYRSNLASIGENAFRSCSGLTEIEIPASTKFIGSDAFYECSSLAKMTLPSSIDTRKIGVRAIVKVVKI